MEIQTPTFDAKPNWEPLERTVASVHRPDFMHIGRMAQFSSTSTEMSAAT